MKALLAAAPLLLAWAAFAQEPAPPQAPREAKEPAVQRLVAEDDNVRIDELRVRGETQSITVTNKVKGLKGTQYQIVPLTGARDPSQLGQSNGQRVWHLFSF